MRVECFAYACRLVLYTGSAVVYFITHYGETSKFESESFDDLEILHGHTIHLGYLNPA